VYEEREKVTLLWLPGHMGIPADMKSQTKKQKLPWKTSHKKNPPQDLINWIKTEDKKTRKTRWEKMGKKRTNVIKTRLFFRKAC
jgi:hypothetical protein